MGLRWRSAAKGGMEPNGIVERSPLPDDPVRLEAVGQIIQIDPSYLSEGCRRSMKVLEKRRGEIKDSLNFSPDPSVIELIPNLPEIYRQNCHSKTTRKKSD